jgi:hypothetical protein
MPKKASANIKPSEPEQVAAYLARLKHPLAEVVAALRQIILKTDASIGEEIKWNAPAFFFTGEMAPFNPKEYKRHLVVMNLAKPDSIRLVLMGGARAKDSSGLLEGDYADGRRLATFTSMAEVKAKQKALQSIVRALLQTLEK